MDNKGRKVYLQNTIIIYNEENNHQKLIGINHSKEDVKQDLISL